jgi:hypothetical protein
LGRIILLSLELLDKHISECTILVEAGNEDRNVLESLLKLRHDLSDANANANANDWIAYNELSIHLPDASADPVLIILKGQLLIERLVRKFINTRLPNPAALEKQQFSAAQCICIAESMCLNNKEPNWLWEQIRELNTIRNKLAHNLFNETIELRINTFIVTVSNELKLESKSIDVVVTRLYGMVLGLCNLSDSKEFKLFNK